MKNHFTKNIINNDNKNNTERLAYGIDIIYTSFTKLIFIIFASILFNCFSITIYCIVFISFLRTFSYGLHMNNSIKCYIFSLFIFVIFPKLFVNINISNLQVLILFLLSTLSFVLYSPSDTHKRPLININKSKALKYKSLFLLILYFYLYICIKDIYISKILLYSIIIQSMLINPVLYKLFNLPYENFKEVIK